MSHPCASDTLEMLRTLLHHLEDAPAYDQANTEFLKRIIRYRIRVLESIYRLASKPPSIQTLTNRSVNAPEANLVLQSGTGNRHRRWMESEPVPPVPADSVKRLKREGADHGR